MMRDPLIGEGAGATMTAAPDRPIAQQILGPTRTASAAEGGPVTGHASVFAPEPVRHVRSEAVTDGAAAPMPPRLVLELEQCFQQVRAGLPAATILEFRARRHHDKAVKAVFDALSRCDETQELAAFVWMKANPSEVISPNDLSTALIYVSRFRDQIFFSPPAMPLLEVLAASDEAALHQFCSIMNTCPDLDIDAVYRAVGRQKKVYHAHEAMPCAQLLNEFNTRRAMGNFRAFLIEHSVAAKQKLGGVGFIRQERGRHLRAESCLDEPTFRKLQARLHFEDRPEIMHILAQSSVYASFLPKFVSAYVTGYEMPAADLATKLGTILLRGK